MSERTLILSRPRVLEVGENAKTNTLASRIFSAINEKYDSIIDFLFKWTS